VRRPGARDHACPPGPNAILLRDGRQILPEISGFSVSGRRYHSGCIKNLSAKMVGMPLRSTGLERRSVPYDGGHRTVALCAWLEGALLSLRTVRDQPHVAGWCRSDYSHSGCTNFLARTGFEYASQAPHAWHQRKKTAAFIRILPNGLMRELPADEKPF